jgi:hypothetical protein
MEDIGREYCEVTNKICYSQREASNIIASVKRWRSCKKPKQIPKRSYYCKYCGCYHLTHFSSLHTCKSTLRRYGAKGFRDF